MLTDPSIEADRNSPTAGPELIDVNVVAELLQCSARTIYRLAESGKMPRPIKLGHLVRWRRVAILKWLDDGCPSVRKPRSKPSAV